MQAQDFLLRRVMRDGGAGLAALIARQRSERASDTSDAAGRTLRLEERLTAHCARLAVLPEPERLRRAEGALRAGWAAVSAHLAWRLSRLGGGLAAAGEDWLRLAEARMAMAEAL
jgi:hypothetical protein